MVKTRFAPSPTGYLHLGNARTAIFSYLFARHSGGRFILRIEDTDRERSTAEFERQLLDDLRWLGIEWDEFYRQSERFEIYGKFAEKLLESGHAYRCFCTQEELEKEREEAKKKGIAYRYSGKCRNLGEEEVKRLLKEGREYTIRFRVPDGEEINFRDLVKGYISINADDFGDFVIVRSDGTPTYNFVVVVDDALMGITHVIRGEDHIPNTPKQILIYRALGFEIPEFAHLPVILGEDRSKLSKRHGGVSVKAYRDEGFLSEALFNYLCLLGWTPPEEEGEILSKEKLIELFDLSGINSSPAVFSREKLLWMNGVYIREVLPIDELLNRAIPFLEREGYDVSDREYVKKVLELTRDSFMTFTQMVERLRPFFRDPDKVPQELVPLVREKIEVVKEFISVLEKEKPESPEAVNSLARRFLKERKLKPKDLWKPLRVVLTGSLEGVGVDILLSVLPLEVTRRRVERFS
jgi:glutamyl-tRNA synthetase/nondiscriminating glutamyl-tRNA synthetase